MNPKMKIICSEEDKNEARKIEEKTVIEHVDTIFNMNMPGK